MQDPRLSVSLASISLAALAGAQGSAFSPCLLERGKELLLGPAGLPAREHGRLGPCGDVDGDGDVDLLWEARTLLNDGSGTFRRSVPSGVPGGEALGLFDADGDGVLDLLLRDELRLGDGSGRFFAASAALPADFVADTALFRDVDGDRTVDLLALERRDWPAPAHVRICLNDGSGHFGEVTHPVAPDDTQVLAAGDVDADGDVDLFLAGESSVELWRNDGAGVFTTDPAAIPAALGRVQAVAPADLNGDLALDLALGLDGTDGTPDATWLENDGTGAFTLRSLPAASTHRRSSVVIALDVEGDGDTDLLCAADAQVLLFFPLANKSYKAMSRLKQLQPKMVALRERYGDDKAKQNEAMMRLYKEEKVNPAAGCLPMLVQIPVFFALYKVLFVSIEMRHAPFYGWIQDLSARDPTSLFNLFGLIPWTPPEFLLIGAWPLLMGATMYLQQKLNPAPADPMQAKIFMLLPFVFTIMLAGFPAGLVIYWAWNNVLSITQQWVIMRRMGVTASGQTIGTPPGSAKAGTKAQSKDRGQNKAKGKGKGKGKTN